MRHFIFVVVLLSACLVNVTIVTAQVGRPTSIPPNAKITLTSDKDTYYFGENVLVHYHVANTGGESFNAESGGDYRGNPRATRFVVIAKDQHGAAAADPFNENSFLHMGGIGGGFAVTVEKPWTSSLQLLLYCDIQKPGTYTLFVWHDLGWTTKDLNDNNLLTYNDDKPDTVTDDPRWAKLELTFKMPDEAAAAKIFEAMTSDQRDHGGTFGKQRKPFADDSFLSRYAIYKPALAKVAAENIAKSPYSPALTRLKLAHANASDDKTLKRHAEQLYGYVPYPPELRVRMNADGLKMREEIVTAGWRDDMVPALMSYTSRLLKMTPDDGLADPAMEAAAQMIASVGTPEEISTVTLALDAIINRTTTTTPISFADYGLPIQLRWAAKALLERGAKPPVNPQSPGEIAIYLEAVKLGIITHSQAQPFLKVWIKHPIDYIRRMTIETLPIPLEPWARTPVLQLLESSSDSGVQHVLLQLAVKSPDPIFAKPSLDLFRSSNDFFMDKLAADAALACGSFRDDILQLWAMRMQTHPNTSPGSSLSNLLLVFEGSNGSWYNDGIVHRKVTAEEKEALSQRWTRFINTNRQALREGRKIPITDPSVTPDLLPAGSYTGIKDRRWPPKQ